MMRVVAWNVGPRSVLSIVASLGGIVAARKAEIVALFEASDRRLVALLKVRYPHRKVLCHRTDVVALISRRAPKPRVEIVGHDVAWIGPHAGLSHSGRRWLLLIWDDHAVLLVHRVPGGPLGGRNGTNRRAWLADLAVIRATVNRGDLPDKLAIVGDHNGLRTELQREYGPLDLILLPANAHVDQCAVRDLKGRGDRLGNHGSDHVALEWRFQ